MTQYELALRYAEAGVSIFPCDPGDKSPLVKKGFLSATSDKSQIDKWWKKYPSALIGGVCDNQFTVLDFDFDKGIEVVGWYSLLTTQFGINTPYTVTTKSGGKHLYFKHNPSITRRISLFKGIDILGKGGYAILPDESAYHIDDLNAFITDIHSLPDVPELISTLCSTNFSNFYDVFETTGQDCRNIKTFLANEQRSKLNKTFDETDTGKGEKFTKEEKRSKLSERIAADKAIYERNQNYIERNPKRYDVTESGAYIIPERSMEKGDINHLFYNAENQKKMAAFMGFPLPTGQRKRKFRSLFCYHTDEKPSMGARWSESGNHIILRDFSNFFGDAEERTDYNLVRMYMQNHYSQTAGKPVSIKSVSAPEFCVWSLRLMYESGVIDITRNDTTDVEGIAGVDKQLMQSFLYLHDIKKLYKNYDGNSVFAKRFASAWSGIKQTSVLRSMWELKRKNVMVESGKYGEGKFVSTLFAVGNTINKNAEDSRSKEFMAQEQLPLGILFGAEIDSSYKETLQNFAVDFEIENIIEEKYMALVFATSEEAQEIQTVLPGPIVVSNFMIYTLEEEGKKSLLVGYDSNLVDKIFSDIIKQYEIDEEEPDKSFVLSYDYNGDDSDETMNELSYQFNQYFPMIEASQEITGYYSEEEIDRFVFGSDLEGND